MRLHIWQKDAKTKLKSAGIATYHQDARQLAQELLKFSDSEMISGDLALSEADLGRLNQALNQRLRGMPLAYILGRAYFYGHSFTVDNRVLIPRPETEQIIEHLVDGDLNNKIILDVGCGSGNIGLSLAMLIKNCTIILSDISVEALGVCAQNLEFYRDQIEARGNKVSLVRSDLLAEFTDQKFDIITANLPYVDPSWSWLNKANLAFEPNLALFAEDRGLSLIKRLLEEVKTKLKKNGIIVLEMDPSQTAIASRFAGNYGFKPAKVNQLAYILPLNLK